MISLSGMGELLRVLAPGAARFDYFDRNGDFAWSSAGAEDSSVSGALASLPEDAFEGPAAAAAGHELQLDGGQALQVFPLLDPAGETCGLLTCLWTVPTGSSSTPTLTGVARQLQPALRLIAEVLAGRHHGRRREKILASMRAELNLLYDLDEKLEQAPHGQARLARLVGTCARHLGIGYSVLILPSKRIRISATHPSWKGADRRALDAIIARHLLPDLAGRTTPSILDMTRSPAGVENPGDGYQMILCPLREEGGRVTGVLALAGQTAGARLDEAEKRFAMLITRKAEQVIERNYDGLTGLVNRAGFEAHLREAYDQLSGEHEAHALVIFDVDKLQLVNDNFGHRTGDDLLRRFAAELQEVMPQEGVCTRLSGDNFAVLLHRLGVEEATSFADEVRLRAHKLTFLRGDKALRVTVSAGVAAFRRDSSGVSGALVAPKVACTAAKEHGGDRVEVYDQDDHSIIRRATDIQLVAHLHGALDKGDFELFAQPIASLSGDEDYRHHEILVRMIDSEGQRVLPEGFLSAAERYQMMPRLDRWIVGHALEQLAERRDYLADRHHVFAINLSGQSIGDDGFLEFVRERVQKSGLPPNCLCFEITETAAVANMNRARFFMDRMKTLGCRFSLDDFGAGMSSFAYLRNFDVDSVKIDGSFVRDINDNPVSEAMVAAITQVARVLRLRTVAEYVASEAVRDKVRALGVDYAQGYFIGEPVSLASVLDELPAAISGAVASAS